MSPFSANSDSRSSGSLKAGTFSPVYCHACPRPRPHGENSWAHGIDLVEEPNFKHDEHLKRALLGGESHSPSAKRGPHLKTSRCWCTQASIPHEQSYNNLRLTLTRLKTGRITGGHGG